MNPKRLKILKKFIFLLPFGVGLTLFAMLVLGVLDLFNWKIGLLAGVLFSAYFMLVNINEYNAIGVLPLEDFLESKHSMSLPNDPAIVAQFNRIIDQQFIEPIVFRYDPQIITVKTKDFVLRLIEENEHLRITIEKHSFDFIPDRAKNFRRLQKLSKALHPADHERPIV